MQVSVRWSVVQLWDQKAGKRKVFPCVHFFTFAVQSPRRKGTLFVFISSLMLNVACTAEVGAAVWGTPSSFLRRNCWKMMV